MDIDELAAELRPALPTQLLGLYLCGSAARGELTPHSDIDLLAVADHALDQGQRKRLTEALLRLSGWAGHRETFPEAANRRPIEFSILISDDVSANAYPPLADYQYGEWLRGDLLAGALPQPFEDPDLLLLREDARQNHRGLIGPDLESFLSTPTPDMLSRACRDALPALLEDLRSDTRNVLLTLARMVTTVTSGRIVSKDVAARHVSPNLPEAESDLLLHAMAEYRGEAVVDWQLLLPAAQRTAGLLASKIQEGI